MTSIDAEDHCLVLLLSNKKRLVIKINKILMRRVNNNYNTTATKEDIIAADYGLNNTLRIKDGDEKVAVHVDKFGKKEDLDKWLKSSESRAKRIKIPKLNNYTPLARPARAKVRKNIIEKIEKKNTVKNKAVLKKSKSQILLEADAQFTDYRHSQDCNLLETEEQKKENIETDKDRMEEQVNGESNPLVNDDGYIPDSFDSSSFLPEIKSQMSQIISEEDSTTLLLQEDESKKKSESTTKEEETNAVPITNTQNSKSIDDNEKEVIGLSEPVETVDELPEKTTTIYEDTATIEEIINPEQEEKRVQSEEAKKPTVRSNEKVTNDMCKLLRQTRLYAKKIDSLQGTVEALKKELMHQKTLNEKQADEIRMLTSHLNESDNKQLAMIITDELTEKLTGIENRLSRKIDEAAGVDNVPDDSHQSLNCRTYGDYTEKRRF